MVERMKITGILVTVGILLITMGAPNAGGADLDGRYIWPLDNHTTLSSGFCDYRPNHYHGGVDLSTDGREGIPVRAADSGWVMRITTSYWGYGKAVYLHLADGRMAVYGHLSEFSDAIEAYVEEKQYSAKRYKQDLWPEAGELPVRRGEVIAKTGQTGAGPPHLHFEIRTGDNRPLNPLVYAFRKTDTHAPLVTEITLVPWQPDRAGKPLSTVNGELLPKTFKVKQTKDGWGIGEAPSITGVVGVRVHTRDVLDLPRYIMSTYRCRVFANDNLIAELRHDSINYDDSRLINLERAFDGAPGYAERPLQMFRLPGNRLWNYTTLKNDGWLRLDQTAIAGTNDIRVEAEDAAGNVTTVSFSVVLNEDYQTSKSVPIDASPSADLVPQDMEWSEGGLVLEFAPSKQTPTVSLGAGVDALHAIRTLDGAWQLWLPPTAAEDAMRAGGSIATAMTVQGYQSVEADRGGSITASDGHATARFAAGDLYYPSYFTLRESSVAGRRSNMRSSVYELGPLNVPFAKSARLSIQTDHPGSTRRTALYRFVENRNDWSFVGADSDPATSRISGEIDYPGVFVLLEDDTNPVIRDVKPKRGSRTRNRRPTIRFTMFDDLSGIASDADVVLTIDGDWVPVEYDPDTRQAKARPRAALAPGEHRVEISVTDQAGNKASFLRILRVTG